MPANLRKLRSKDCSLEFLPYAALKVIVDYKYKVIHFSWYSGLPSPIFLFQEG